MPQSRFDRDPDISDFTGVPSIRFDRLGQESRLIEARIRSGARLAASLAGDQIYACLEPDSLSGRYPSFHVALTSLGASLEGEGQEEVPGSVSDQDPIDQAFLDGNALTVEKLGFGLLATWVKSLPIRTFTDRGVIHRVYRKGVRKAKGDTILETCVLALRNDMTFLEGMLLR